MQGEWEGERWRKDRKKFWGITDLHLTVFGNYTGPPEARVRGPDQPMGSVLRNSLDAGHQTLLLCPPDDFPSVTATSGDEAASIRRDLMCQYVMGATIC